MAIGALKAQTDGDTISRQDVIDTVHKIIYGFFSCADGVMTDTEKTLLSVSKAVCNGVRELPSAQPEERTEERTETHACDLIDRQAAIDVLDKNHILGRGDLNEVLDHIVERLEKLPPAQPKKRTEERTETHACDCISRKASIDAHYEYCNKHPDAGFPVWSLKILEYLPSAQPQRTGRWELIDDTEFRIPGYRCSVCHCECEDWDKKPTYRFCPNCGSFNGGENEV